MAELRFINHAQVGELLTLGRLRPALEAALVAQSEGRANVPPRIAAVAPAGLLATMPGYLDGVGMAAKIVTVFPGSKPSHQGLVMLADSSTGRPLAIMDAEVITERRTAMTAAIAADRLARTDAAALTIVGAGAQGHAHLQAFGRLRPWREIRIVSRTRNASTVLAADARFTFGPDVTIHEFDGFEEAVRGADVVALCTHADAPVLEPAWIEPGTHVSSIGSLAELPPGLVGPGLVVDQLGAVTAAPPAGAVELQGMDVQAVVELGVLIADPSLGRRSDEQITVYKSTGHAVQDIAAARVVFDAALDAAVGAMVEL
jgi:ornithine cyclodeaminase/alanine dehydrogenase-like protein (mu-crystallin family)